MNKIDFKNYPLQSNDINIYAKKLKLCITLYHAMLNCFEGNVIENVLHDTFKILIEKFEKYFLNQINKTENENIFKQ